MYRSDYEHFINSPMWHEIVATCKEAMAGIGSDLAHLDPYMEATDMARKQGRLAAMEWMLAQPGAILEEIEAVQIKQEKGEE